MVDCPENGISMNPIAPGRPDKHVKSRLRSWPGDGLKHTQYIGTFHRLDTGRTPCAAKEQNTAQHKTKQNKTRQGNTRQGKTTQHKAARQNKTRSRCPQWPADFHFFSAAKCQVSVFTPLPGFRVQSILCRLATRLVFAWRRYRLDDFTLVQMVVFCFPYVRTCSPQPQRSSKTISGSFPEVAKALAIRGNYGLGF